MIKNLENLKAWVLSNIALIFAVAIYVSLRLSWKELFQETVAIDVATIITISSLAISHVIQDRNEKIIFAMAYLSAMIASGANVFLALAAIIFVKFLLERTHHLFLVGLLLLSAIFQTMAISLGLELALSSTPTILMYVNSLIVLLALLFMGRDKTVLLSILILMVSGVIDFRSYADSTLWLALSLSLLCLVRLGIFKSLCVLIFFLALTTGDYYLFAIAFVITVLDSFNFNSKSELLPAIGILSIAGAYPQIALFYFVIVIIKTLSRSRVQAWLTKHHS